MAIWMGVGVGVSSEIGSGVTFDSTLGRTITVGSSPAAGDGPQALSIAVANSMTRPLIV